MTEFQIRTRNYIFKFLVVVAFLVLFGQLWNLQVVQGETYRELADANRFRVTQVPASRGIIYDRNGALLVRNRPVYNVVIVPAFLPEDDTARARVFARLSELLNLPITTQVETIGGRNNGYFNAINHHQYNRVIQRQIVNPRSRRFVNEPLGIRDAVDQSSAFAPFLPIEIATDVDPITVSKIEEERLELPGVLVDIAPSRDYLHGALTSHILGYTGPIPAEQFEQYETQGYGLTDRIGLAGLEIQYEDKLRGIKGLENIEVDVTGQKIRTVSQDIQVQPGHNLRLTLDLELQQVTAEALQAQMDEVGSQQGVAIALNPQNGEILALVTLPSFDNNLFSRGITPRELSLLSEDPQTPLVNHATAGLYPPGSIFKLVTASGALQERVVTPEMTVLDEGILYLPNQFAPDNLDLAQPFFCWLREGHGLVNIVSALAWSCNVYFHYVGGGFDLANYEGLGLERLGLYARMYGLGEPTGIDLPGELGGLVPDQRWKRLNYAETWLTGDTYNMAIGQGFVLITPLQMVNAYAAIANGGTLYRPHLVKEILDADDNVVETINPEPIGRLALDPQNIQLIRQGLHGVVNWDTGTAYEHFDVPGVDASGKTGTAEFCDNYPQCLDRDGRVKTSHAWFVSYAPTNNPEIVTIVFVYGGKQGAGIAVQGSEVAVPVTNAILRHYFQIPDEEETEEEPEESEDEEPVAIPPETQVTARFLGADAWYQENVGIYGFVLDETGQGLTGVRVEVSAQGAPVAEFITVEEGRFEYNASKLETRQSWQIRLPDYPQAKPIELEVSNGLRYLLEFEIQPPPEAAPVAEVD